MLFTINSYGVFPFDVSTSRFWEDPGLPGAFAATAGPPSPTAATTSGRRGAGAHAGIGVADCNGGDGPVSRGRDEGGLHLRGRAIPIQSDELNLRQAGQWKMSKKSVFEKEHQYFQEESHLQMGDFSIAMVDYWRVADFCSLCFDV